MRKALILGVDHYQHRPSLGGCVSDALRLEPLLARHANGDANFACQSLLAIDAASAVERIRLRRAVEALFNDNDDLTEVALLYFAGHGTVNGSGGVLLSSDSRDASDGLGLDDLMLWANRSRARHRLLLLDCCHSGAAAAEPDTPQLSRLAEGVTVLTAATARQEAMEQADGGLFTTLLVEALAGGAANLVGDVSPCSVYAFIDQSLGAWQQRPVFKANVQTFVSLRRTEPPLDPEDLRQLTSLFPSRDHVFPLDPRFEPRDEARRREDPPADRACVRQFRILQAYNRLQLLVPIDAPDMWTAAMNRRACQLTPLGQHYWRLVNDERI